MNTQTEILQFLKQQAYEAGSLMRASYQKTFDVFVKADSSKVTSVDLAISKQFQTAQQKHFPNIGLFSEESGSQTVEPNKDYFIVDELDGTSYFIEGIPGFSHQSAYFDSTEGLVIGVIYFPIQDELVYAIKGEGAFLESKGQITPLQTPLFPPLDLLRYGHPQRYKGKKYYYLLEDIGVHPDHIVLTTAYKTLQFARGELEVSIYAKPFMAPWDWAGDKVILEELGFSYSYLDGRPLDFFHHPVNNNRGYLICPKNYATDLPPKIIPNLYT